MSEPESSPVQIGDFRIIKQIGAGGMGIVYLAKQVSLDRLVALKVLGDRLNRPSDKARFQREAQAVAKLTHPNIATVHFVGQDDRLCYMAMEYIDGVSLREVIERFAKTTDRNSCLDDFVTTLPPNEQLELERFDEIADTLDLHMKDDSETATLTAETLHSISSKKHIRRCCEIVRDAAYALAHAHAKGLVHRDIKPGNLMLAREGQIYVIDFGLAHWFGDRGLTQTGQLIGTLRYMSPEQVTGRIELDQRSDIYSLGLVLYELLTLESPISATDPEGVLRSIVAKAVVPVSWHNPAIPVDLQNVVHKAIAKDPDQRYSNQTSFAEDLQRLLNEKSVDAPTYRYKLGFSEIVATRPIRAEWVAYHSFFIVYAVAFFLGIHFVVYIESSWEPLYPGVLSLLVGCGWAAAARYFMLGGYSWRLAWLNGAVIATVAAIAAYNDPHLLSAPLFAGYGLLITFGILQFIAVTPFVFRKDIQDWFRFAHQLRQEHKAHTKRR